MTGFTLRLPDEYKRETLLLVKLAGPVVSLVKQCVAHFYLSGCDKRICDHVAARSCRHSSCRDIWKNSRDCIKEAVGVFLLVQEPF